EARRHRQGRHSGRDRQALRAARAFHWRRRGRGGFAGLRGARLCPRARRRGGVMSGTVQEARKLGALPKLLIDFGPLLVFFAVNGTAGIFPATAAFMVAFFVSLAIGYWFER